MAAMAEEPRYSLVDTHCHLTWQSFGDVPEVLARARAAGVIRMLTVATDLPSCRAALALAADNDDVRVAVGIHPNDVTEIGDMAAVSDLARQDRVVAIGETGLDYYRDRVPPSLQRRAFDGHLALAATLNLPVVIHNRQADEDVLAAITAYRDRVRGVLHCFSGDGALASRAVELGYYVSFAGNITYPSAGALREVASEVPSERVLVETDAPFLSPIPQRGRRNEPAFVAFTLHALAAARREDPSQLARQVVANAQALFAW